mgnify:CR=1
MCILFFHAHPPSFFRYSFAVSVLHALHAVYDVDAGRQVVPLLGQLYAVKVVDALLAGGTSAVMVPMLLLTGSITTLDLNTSPFRTTALWSALNS